MSRRSRRIRDHIMVDTLRLTCEFMGVHFDHNIRRTWDNECSANLYWDIDLVHGGMHRAIISMPEIKGVVTFIKEY